MRKEELIESGLLELYILGELSAEDASQIEEYFQDDEIKNQLNEIEHRLEVIGMENAKTPPADVFSKILSAIDSPEARIDESTASIDTKWNHRLSALRRNFAMAATLAGLLALALVWQLFSNGNDATDERLANLESQVEKLSQSNTVITDQLAYINHTYTTPLVLRGTQVSPNSKAVVYWNPKVDEALLSTNGLPTLPEGKVYQIWADISGEMVSMKVFTLDEKLVTLPFMPNAESLNVTVEPEGGSDHPNVKQLYVNGATEI